MEYDPEPPFNSGRPKTADPAIVQQTLSTMAIYMKQLASNPGTVSRVEKFQHQTPFRPESPALAVHLANRLEGSPRQGCPRCIMLYLALDNDQLKEPMG
jgi:hypothetical protein